MSLGQARRPAGEQFDAPRRPDEVRQRGLAAAAGALVIGDDGHAVREGEQATTPNVEQERVAGDDRRVAGQAAVQRVLQQVAGVGNDA
mgnify:CR=1 FL=1